jgi:lipopolysaccharide/colanic/teichoic acid biosynthesis glycosyltransferase
MLRPLLQRFYETTARSIATVVDNGAMLATESPSERGSGVLVEFTGANRIPQSISLRPLPFAIRVLYLIEPVIAALSLIFLAPFLAVLALIIWMASGASPLVAHRRVGRYGTPLWVYKFRTMWPDTPRPRRSASWIETVAEERPRLKHGPDPRVTSRFAAFCRRHSLDELPQLVLVATGRMSIVGPRPITRFELHEHYDVEAMDVLSLRPGLTGLWQVRGRSRLSYRQRKRFDLFLVRRFSIGLYLRIVALTIPEVLFFGTAW